MTPYAYGNIPQVQVSVEFKPTTSWLIVQCSKYGVIKVTLLSEFKLRCLYEINEEMPNINRESGCLQMPINANRYIYINISNLVFYQMEFM